MSEIEEITDSVILAYLNKELSNEDMIKVDLWLARSSANMAQFNEVRRSWKKKSSKLSEDLESRNFKDNSSYEAKPINRPADQRAQSKNKGAKSVAILAATAAIGVIGALMVFFVADEEKMEESREEISSSGMLELVASGETVTEVLSDGSKVVLLDNSTLLYPPEFDNTERRVSLVGECVFDVLGELRRPFIVELPHDAFLEVFDDAAFDVMAYEEEDEITVVVSSGSVYLNSDKDVQLIEESEIGTLDIASGAIEVLGG